MEKVCAVIVLYNNSLEFKKCLQALENQGRVLDHYIFVDNSDDDFSTLNREIVFELKLEKERFTYVRSKENKGSAFGFALGMWIAKQKNFDLIWLNDQDGVAGEHCLEKIIESFNRAQKDVGIYVPNVCDLKTKKILPGFHMHINRFLHGGFSSDKEIDSFGTAGVCITRNTVEKIGYYNYNVCYIGNEDKEYALRAKKNNLKIKYVGEAVYFHPDAFEKYKMRRKIRRYYFLQDIIPLNMGLILKGKENDLRNNRLCVSSAYINNKYAAPFFRNINYLYNIVRLLISKSCNINATLMAYKKGKELAYKQKDSIDDEKDLKDFYIRGLQ